MIPYGIDKIYHKLYNKFNFKNLSFPIALKGISQFEKQKFNGSINVYGLYITFILYILRILKVEKKDNFNLLSSKS